MALPNFEYENALTEYSCIAGIDEAGRGPLAGPVVAAAVVFHNQFEIPLLNDSKKLSDKVKNELYDTITKSDDISYGVGIVDHKKIDEINILNATYMAMELAADNLKGKPDFLLIDGNRFKSLKYTNYQPIVKGDQKSMSIAAASIIAKVTRDRMMIDYHKKYPQYGFDTHKGYGSEKHFAAIDKHGKCPIHRNSFLVKYENRQRELF